MSGESESNGHWPGKKWITPDNYRSAIPNRQSVTSFCTSDVAECKRMFQIGDW